MLSLCFAIYLRVSFILYVQRQGLCWRWLSTAIFNHGLCERETMYLTLSEPDSIPSISGSSSCTHSSSSMLLASLALVACFLVILDFAVAFEAAAITRDGFDCFRLPLAFLRTFLKLSRVCCLPATALLAVVGAMVFSCWS